MNETAVDTSHGLASLGATRPLVIAHRGASRVAPENSLAAFEAAIEAGADCVELDVRQTSDGVLVAHHAAARRGVPVTRLTYADLSRRSRHRPPRLEEVVRLCAGRVRLDVEIKQPGCEAAALEQVSRGYAPREVLLSSFHDEVVAGAKRITPDLTCGLLLGPTRLRPLRRDQSLVFELGARCGADFIALHQVLLPAHPRRRSPNRAPAPAALPLLIWTVNSISRMAAYLADPRVAGIITDLPALAVEARRRLEEHQVPRPGSRRPSPLRRVTRRTRHSFPGRLRPESRR